MTDKPELLRYCYDTEFVDRTARFKDVFMSIGIVPVNFEGPNYYGVSKEFNTAAAVKTVPWLQQNVIDKLPPLSDRKSIKTIRAEILSYLKPAKKVELWAKNGSYDAVQFCMIMGGMMNMRKSLKAIGIDEIVFRDIDELTRVLGNPKLPKEPEATAHISVEDAAWDKYLLHLLSMEIKQESPTVFKALGL